MLAMQPDDLADARQVLAEEPSTACLVGLDGRIVYCNPAWDAFARGNEGDPGALGATVTGMPWRSFIRGEEVATSVSSFMEFALRGESTSFLCECNSAEIGRVIMNRFEPVRSKGSGRTVGVAAVYDVVRSCPIQELHQPSPHQDGLYRDTEGIVHMCAFCRRVLRRGHDERWDFVPYYLKAAFDPNLSHGYCNTCYALLCED
jgi:hypothetical protein